MWVHFCMTKRFFIRVSILRFKSFQLVGCGRSFLSELDHVFGKHGLVGWRAPARIINAPERNRGSCEVRRFLGRVEKVAEEPQWAPSRWKVWAGIN